MRILRTARLSVAGGLLIASVLTYLTSPAENMKSLGLGVYTQAGHTDFWTGEVTPAILTRYDGSGRVTNVYEIPENWKNLRVIPFPVGFAVGSLLTLTVITLASRRPGKAQPDSLPAV